MWDENQCYTKKPWRIELSLDEIRKATDTEDKFIKNNDLRKRVIDIAVREINENAQFSIPQYGYIKDGRTVTGFYFVVQYNHYHILPSEKEEKLLQMLR